jgi:hypothetical protein
MVITPSVETGAAPAPTHELPLYVCQFVAEENVTSPFVLKSPADCPCIAYPISNQQPATNNIFLVALLTSFRETDLNKETIFLLPDIKRSG